MKSKTFKKFNEMNILFKIINQANKTKKFYSIFLRISSLNFIAQFFFFSFLLVKYNKLF